MAEIPWLVRGDETRTFRIDPEQAARHRPSRHCRRPRTLMGRATRAGAWPAARQARRHRLGRDAALPTGPDGHSGQTEEQTTPMAFAIASTLLAVVL